MKYKVIFTFWAASKAKVLEIELEIDNVRSCKYSGPPEKRLSD